MWKEKVPMFWCVGVFLSNIYIYFFFCRESMIRWGVGIGIISIAFLFWYHRPKVVSLSVFTRDNEHRVFHFPVFVATKIELAKIVAVSIAGLKPPSQEHASYFPVPALRDEENPTGRKLFLRFHRRIASGRSFCKTSNHILVTAKEIVQLSLAYSLALALLYSLSLSLSCLRSWVVRARVSRILKISINSIRAPSASGNTQRCSLIRQNPLGKGPPGSIPQIRLLSCNIEVYGRERERERNARE